MTRAQRTAAAARAHALTMVRAITAAAAHSAEQWPLCSSDNRHSSPTSTPNNAHIIALPRFLHSLARRQSAAIENNVCYSTAEAIQSSGDSNSSDGSDQEPASPHGSPLLRQADFDEPFLDGGDPFLDVGADESEAESSVGGTGSDLDEDEMGGRDDLFDDDELENELDQMLAGGMLFGEDDGDEGGARMAMKTEASISNNSSSGTRASTPRTGKTFSTL
ncbi:unnamed protein product [Tilletia controversa]|nr:unnamed protein product [Tilletia controversa]